MTGTTQKPPLLGRQAVSTEGKTFASSLPQERMGVMREDEIREMTETERYDWMNDVKERVMADVPLDYNAGFHRLLSDCVSYENELRILKQDNQQLLEQLDIIKSDNTDLRKLYRAEVEENQRMVELFEKLQRVTGQATHWPIEYEHFVQRVTHQALNPPEATPCTPS